MRRKFTIKNGQKKSHLIKKTKQDGVSVKQQQSHLFGKYTAQNKPFEQAKWPAQSCPCLDASCHTNGERSPQSGFRILPLKILMIMEGSGCSST
jgi:hypothetical protein